MDSGSKGIRKTSFAPPKTAFAPMQNGVAPVQEALCSLGPKDLLNPPLSTFGNFPFSGPQLPNLSQGLVLSHLLGEIETSTKFKISSVRAATRANFFSVFLCQRCGDIWREIFGAIFCVLRFPGFGCPNRKISPTFHPKNGVKNGKFHAKFTLRGHGADLLP